VLLQNAVELGVINNTTN